MASEFMNDSIQISNYILQKLVIRGSRVIEYEHDKSAQTDVAIPYATSFLKSLCSLKFATKDDNKTDEPLSSEPVIYTNK